MKLSLTGSGSVGTSGTSNEASRKVTMNYIFTIVLLFGAFWLGVLFFFVPRDAGITSLSGTSNSSTDNTAGSVGNAQQQETVHVERIPLSTKITYPLVQELNMATYPKYERFDHVIERWNPDDSELPVTFTETLQHFDYSKPEERAMAQKYRDEEVPFKLYNVPEVDAVSLKWTDEYLQRNLDAFGFRVERSANNHFMFYHANKNVKPPSDIVRMSFNEFRELARVADTEKLDSEQPHHYISTGTGRYDKDSDNFFTRDMKFFSTHKPNFFITSPKENKGIQCRFGMRGTNAASHYDTGRNMIAVFRGTRRYILNPPSACKLLSYIPDNRHPSFRHSIVDMTDLEFVKNDKIAAADTIDTIVRDGEVLYVPSWWAHYVISLDFSVQCNSRSGTPPGRQGEKDMKECIGPENDTP